MKIFIGSDHQGFKLKEDLVNFLKKNGFKVFDLGAYSELPSDYPLISYEVARRVAKEKQSKGILICKTGIGSTIVANKVIGVRAALCYNLKATKFSRQHNDANLLVLGSDFVSPVLAKRIATTFFKTEFLGSLKRNERHLRRVKQIEKIERKCLKV